MKTLSELKQANIPQATCRTLLKVSKDFAPEDEIIIDKYLAGFAQPNGGKCIRCGLPQGGFLGMFTWGLAHGEGYCSKCGYPARGIHRNFGTIEHLAMILQYHPSVLEGEFADPAKDDESDEG